MAFDKTLVSKIKITTDDLIQLGIDSNLSDLEKWEAAFSVFESNEEEISKFEKRYKKLGLDEGNKNEHIAELFCGKGNSLLALERLGYKHLTGVDLSSNLLSKYQGKANTIVSDCLQMPLINDNTFDKVIIQGGIHHLPDLKTNLPKLFNEIKRILKDDGQFIIIEPWLTLFLQFVHLLSSFRLIRMVNNKICAFAIMVYFERDTYQYWLCHSDLITNFIHHFFNIKYSRFTYGKFISVLKKKR